MVSHNKSSSPAHKDTQDWGYPSALFLHFLSIGSNSEVVAPHLITALCYVLSNGSLEGRNVWLLLFLQNGTGEDTSP